MTPPCPAGVRHRWAFLFAVTYDEGHSVREDECLRCGLTKRVDRTGFRDTITYDLLWSFGAGTAHPLRGGIHKSRGA